MKRVWRPAGPGRSRRASPGPTSTPRAAAPPRVPDRRRSSGGPLTAAVSATGNLNAVITVQVGSQVSGQIKELLADFNSQVKRGPAHRPHRPRDLRGQGQPGAGRRGLRRGRGDQPARPGRAGPRRRRERAGRRSPRARPRRPRPRSPSSTPARPRPQDRAVPPGAHRPERHRHRPGRARLRRGPARVGRAKEQALAAAIQSSEAQLRWRRPSSSASEARSPEARGARSRPQVDLDLHGHPRPRQRRGRLAHRRRRPDGGGQPPGAHALHDRPGPDQDAGRDQRGRGRHRAHPGRASPSRSPWTRSRARRSPASVVQIRKAPEAGAERGHLQRRHRVDNPGAAPARHDRERARGRREPASVLKVAERGAALPARRGEEPGPAHRRGRGPPASRAVSAGRAAGSLRLEEIRERLVQELKLTEEQQKKLEPILRGEPHGSYAALPGWTQEQRRTAASASARPRGRRSARSSRPSSRRSTTSCRRRSPGAAAATRGARLDVLGADGKPKAVAVTLGHQRRHMHRSPRGELKEGQEVVVGHARRGRRPARAPAGRPRPPAQPRRGPACAASRDAPCSIVVHGLWPRTTASARTPCTRCAGSRVAIEPGEFVAVMGPSGSGKSTFMNLLGLPGPARPRAATCSTAGRRRRRRARAGRDPQPQDRLRLPGVQPAARARRALENVELPLLYARPAARASAARRARDAARRGGPGRPRAPPAEPALGRPAAAGGHRPRAGQRRRPLILADEPTGNLDTRTSVEIMALFQQLNRSRASRSSWSPTSPTSPSYARRILAFRDGRLRRDEPGAQPATPQRAPPPRRRARPIEEARHERPRSACASPLRALRVNKLRSALTMLGIIIGVGAVIAMVAVGAGAQARVAEQIRSLGSNLLIVLPGSVDRQRRAARLRARGPRSPRTTPPPSRARSRPSRSPRPAVRGTRRRWSAATLNWSTAIQGVTADYFEARDWPVAAGRSSPRRSSTAPPRSPCSARPWPRTCSATPIRWARWSACASVPLTVIGVLDAQGPDAAGARTRTTSC